MATYTIKIDKRNKAAKAFIEMIKNLSFIEIIEDKPQEPHYDPAFVRKIKKAKEEIEQGNYTEIDTDDIWGSIEL